MIQHNHLPPAHHNQEKTTQEHASHYPQVSYHFQTTYDRSRPLTSHWTQNEDRHLASLCEAGCSYIELGQELQRTPGAIDKRLDLLEKRPGYTSLRTFRDRQHAYLMNTYWGPKMKARFFPLLEQGKSDAEIADILDIDVNIVTARRLRFGGY